MKLYVVGFAFSEDTNSVVLVHKNRPEWQAGFINGIGGKIEDSDANYATAMSREFLEETGVLIPNCDWDHFATLHFGADKLGGEAFVFAFRTFTDDIRKCKTRESEKIEIFRLGGPVTNRRTIVGRNLIAHVETLLPMARERSFNFGDFKMK